MDDGDWQRCCRCHRSPNDDYDRSVLADDASFFYSISNLLYYCSGRWLRLCLLLPVLLLLLLRLLVHHVRLRNDCSLCWAHTVGPVPGSNSPLPHPLRCHRLQVKWDEGNKWKSDFVQSWKLWKRLSVCRYLSFLFLFDFFLLLLLLYSLCVDSDCRKHAIE